MSRCIKVLAWLWIVAFVLLAILAFGSIALLDLAKFVTCVVIGLITLGAFYLVSEE